jgi:hypothetical protein
MLSILLYFTADKNVDMILLGTARFWNNLHQVRSKSKDWKAKYVFGAITPNGLNSIVTVG